jgi:dTDP-glucose 4,6-dehydratase
MRILVTGGAGFIGSHLCNYFLEKGHSVICLDNLLTGTKENIIHLLNNERFRFLQHNITEPINIEEKIDCVMHLASPASPADYLRLPIQTLKVGSLGTLIALGLAKRKGAQFLLASTSEVYGDPQEHPQSETYWGHVNPVGPRGVYDEAKRFAEALTMAYHREHGIDTKIARIFNTYGPGMRLEDGRALPTFMIQALRGEDLTVFGDGKQTRSFCYISDMVEGLYKLLLSREHEPVNLGNPSEITLLQLASEIIELTSSKSKVVFKPLPVDDPKQRRPDITKAKKTLGWEPKVDRREGLLKTLEYFSQKVQKQAVTIERNPL